MSISKTIRLYALILASTIWLGCNECNTFSPTEYVSQFTIRMPVPESEWFISVDLRESTCPESALKGRYALTVDGTFRNGAVIPGQPRSPLPDFPLFEQDLDIDSIFVAGLEGSLKRTLILNEVESHFYLNLPGKKQITVTVNEASSGCFILTPSVEIDSVIARAVVRFPQCELNDSNDVYAVMGAGENKRSLSTDDLTTLYDDNVGFRTYWDFDLNEVNIPREHKRIRVRFTVKIVNHFTSEVIKVLPVDVTVERENFSYEIEP